MSELPEGWVETNLGLLVNYGVTEKVAPANIADDDWVLELEDIEKETSRILQRRIYLERTSKSTKSRFIVNDVLYGKLRPYLNKVILADRPGVCTTEIIPLRAPKGIEPKFIFYALKRPEFLVYAISASHGMDMPRLGTQAGKDASIPLPPTGEQRRIVAKLDSLRAHSARARHELDLVPKLIERYKQGILAKAFSGEMTKEWRSYASITTNASYSGSGIDGRMANELRDLPSFWNWTSLDQAAFVSGGLTKNAKRAAVPTKAKYIRVANVYANELRLADIAEIGCTVTELEKTRLEPGDLLIVEGNGSLDQIGRVALWDGEVADCSHQNHIIRARPQGSLLPKYALYWLLSPIGRTAIERVASSSSGLHTLSISKVSALPIPICHEREQAEIVSRIEHALTWLGKIATEHARASHLLPKLDQAILGKAFRGELVSQDPNDEPASVLLDRIRAEREDNPPKKQTRRGRKATAAS